MQPNNQNPYQQGQNPPPSNTPPQVTGYAGANVPDYLQLDPIQDPTVEAARRRKRKTIIVVVLVAIILTVISVMLFIWYMNYNSPQERLYRALDSSMKTKYVKVESISSSEENETKRELSVAAEIDLSDPREPMARIDQESKRTRTGVEDKRTFESIVSGADLFTQVKQADKSYLAGGLMVNQWYRMPRASNGKSAQVQPIYNEPERMVVSPLGVVIKGNLSDETRLSLVSYLRSNGVYKVLGIKETAGQTEYSIEVNRSAFETYNKKAAEVIGVRYTYSPLPYPQAYEDLKIWVDHSTNSITKTSYVGGVKELDKPVQMIVKRDVTISYPSGLTLRVPEEAKDIAD